MPDTTPMPQQMQDLSQAIADLLPAIRSLAESLSLMETEAQERQVALATALDRIGSELETLSVREEQILKTLEAQKEEQEAINRKLTELADQLSQSDTMTQKLEAKMETVINFLEGPA